MNACYVEPEEEVFPEFVFAAELLQILIGGRDHSDVHRYPSIASQTLNFLILNKPEDFCLTVGTHIPDFIKKQAALVGRLQPSFIPGVSPSKSTFGMSK